MKVTLIIEPASEHSVIQLAEQTRAIPLRAFPGTAIALQRLWACWPEPSEHHFWAVVDHAARSGES